MEWFDEKKLRMFIDVIDGMVFFLRGEWVFGEKGEYFLRLLD